LHYLIADVANQDSSKEPVVSAIDPVPTIDDFRDLRDAIAQQLTTEAAHQVVYLIERRDGNCKTLNTVAQCSDLVLVERAIHQYLQDGLEPVDDVGDWHFCVLECKIDDFTPLGMRAVQRRDRHNQVMTGDEKAVFAGTCHRVRLEIRDGEHEYGDDAYFVAHPGQDPYELADAIACFNLSGSGSYIDKDSNCFQASGDYRLCESNFPSEIPHNMMPSGWNLAPRGRALHWLRMVRKGPVNFSPDEIVGSVVFVNVMVRSLQRPLTIHRVYISELVPEDDINNLAESYVREALDICWLTKGVVEVMDVNFWKRQQAKKKESASNG
jgi:hypothetical protein